MVPRVGAAPRFKPLARSHSSDTSTTKRPYRSPSPSSEADDEESLYDPPPVMASGDASSEQKQSRYPGEDTRLTSRKELAAWYSYGWAAEVFVVCGIGSFVPLTLEQLARERGVLQSDKTTPCKPSFETSGHGARAVAGLASRAMGQSDQCIIYVFGREMNTASFAMYTFSLSVFIQALLIISVSAAADHGRYRKSFLLTCAFVGSISTMLFVTVVPKVYLLGAFLSIVSNVCIGMSFVLLNSFLPLLVRYHPSVQKNALHRQAPPRNAANTYASPDTTAPDAGIHEEDDNPADSMADSTAALLARPGAARQRPALKRRMSRVDSPEMHLSTQISSYGMGIGYLASVLVQSLCILIVVTMGSTLLSLRVVLLAIGAWWLVFTLPAVIWMRPRPGPPLPAALQRRGWPGYLAYAWKSLGKTVLRAWQLRDVMLFLSAWFLVSDGIATVSGTAVLFAKTELGMRPAAVAGINVIATVCGVIGAFSWRRLSRVLRLDPSQTILACICLFELIPLYGLLGYIPAVQRWGVLGLQQPWEMFLLGAVYGFVLGGLSSYCRSLFSQLIPPGSEAAFYALYAITDKGSSVFGPAIVGAITDRAGRIRPAFIFLAFLVGLPAPLMWAVDVDRGRREGGRLLRELGQTQAVDDDDEDDDGDVSDEEMLRQS